MSITQQEIEKLYPWLTSELLEQNLRIRYNEPNLKVINCDLTAALGPGENYGSIVIRSKLELENAHQHNMNIIVKLSPTRPDIVEMMEDFSLFDKEIYFYTDILNEVHRLLKDVGIDVKLSADLIGSDKNPTYMMFEDLSLLGYKNVNKSDGLDYEYLKQTLTKVAYFHAATAHLGLTNPSKLESFTEGLVNEKNIDKPNPIPNWTLGLGTEIVKWEGYEEIGKKLLELAPKIVQHLADFYKEKSTVFNVINHGDLWCNNVMYKHNPDNGKLEDSVFVDFAYGCWHSPAYDLTYLLYSSSANEITEHDWDTLLQHYHSILKTTLEKLNYVGRIPSLRDIQVAILNGSVHSKIVGLLVCGMRYLDKHEEGTISNLVDNTDEAKQFQQIMYSNPKFKVVAQRLLSYFVRKGILE